MVKMSGAYFLTTSQMSKGYKPFVTTDITKGEFTADSDFSFDGTYRHGTVMPITQAEYESLTAE